MTRHKTSDDVTLSSVTDTVRSPAGDERAPGPASPKPRRRVRPGWKAILVRQDTFREVRAIQKSMVDTPIDLCHLADACLRMALEGGAEKIMRRAVSDIGYFINRKDKG